MEQIIVTEDNLEVLTLEFKQKVPRQFTTELECIKFIMYFRVLHESKLKELDEVKLYDKLTNLKLKALQTICHGIKYFVNDGAYLAAIDYVKDLYKNN
jgi:hypothetical protein